MTQSMEQEAANTLKALIKKQGFTYAQLADLVGEKEVNIRNKLSRGTFSAAFFLTCLKAMGVEKIHLD